MNIIERKSYDQQKVQGKGVTFKHCYFEGCTISINKSTFFIGCHLHNVKIKRKIDCSRVVYCHLVDSDVDFK